MYNPGVGLVQLGSPFFGLIDTHSRIPKLYTQSLKF